MCVALHSRGCHRPLPPACIAATRSINRFALVRKLGSDPTGIFNWKLWDGMARK